MSDLEGFMGGLSNLGRSTQSYQSAVPNIPGSVQVPGRSGGRMRKFADVLGIVGQTVLAVEEAKRAEAERQRMLQERAFKDSVDTFNLLMTAGAPAGKQIEALDAALKIKNPDFAMSEADKDALKALEPELLQEIAKFESSGEVNIPAGKLIELGKVLPFSPQLKPIYDRMVATNEQQLAGRGMEEALNLFPAPFRESDLVNTLTEEQIAVVANETDPVRASQEAHRIAAANTPTERFALDDVQAMAAGFNQMKPGLISMDETFLRGQLASNSPTAVYSFFQSLLAESMKEKKDPRLSMKEDDIMAQIFADEILGKPLDPLGMGYKRLYFTKNAGKFVGSYREAMDEALTLREHAATLKKGSPEREEAEATADRMYMGAMRGLGTAATVLDSLEQGEETQSTQQYTMKVLRGLVDQQGGEPMDEVHFAAELVGGHLLHNRLSHVPPTVLFDQLVNKAEGEEDSPLVGYAKAVGLLDPKKKVNYNRLRNAVDPLFDQRMQDALRVAENRELSVSRAKAAQTAGPPVADPYVGMGRSLGGDIKSAGRKLADLFTGNPTGAQNATTTGGFGQFIRGSQKQKQGASLVPEGQADQLTGR